MAVTENDVRENIVAGNLYMKPNIRGVLSYINEQQRIATVDCTNATIGTIGTTAYLQGATGYKDFYGYFRDDSYIRLRLNETWIDGLIPTLSALGFEAYIGINNNGTITEYILTSSAGLPTMKTKYTWTGATWDSVSVAYAPNDSFNFSLMWCEAAYLKLRTIFIPANVQILGYNYKGEEGILSPNIMTGGAVGVIQLNTSAGQIIGEFLAGQSSPGIEYPGEDSETGGGYGDFYGQNDVIDIPAFPNIQAIDFGFNTIYNPSISDVKAIARWLWSDDFTDNIKMNFSSPFENILAIAIVPVNVSSEISDFVIGNTNSMIQTSKVTNQYIEIDCGSLNIREYWGNFLDYDATYSIWLPFIGYRSLKPDDMVDGELGVVYHIDLLTGACVCFVWALKEGVKHVLYTYNTTIFYNVAISGANYMAMYNQQLSATVSGINNAVNSAQQIASGNILGGITSLFTGSAMAKREYETAKPDYGRGGNSGGNSGIFSIRYPYLIKSQPIGQTPKNYKSLQGVPSQIYKTLSDLTGYTEIETVIADTLIHCTQDEKSDIINQLKGGVIL